MADEPLLFDVALLGELVVTSDRCGAGTLRVPSITCDGTPLPAERVS